MYCPACGTKNTANAIACQSCGAVLPGLTEALEGMPVGEGTVPAIARSAGAAVRTFQDEGEAQARARAALLGGPGTPVSARPKNGAPVGGVRVGHVKLVVEQGRILGEQFLLNDFELIIGRYDAGSGRCPDIDLTAQDPAYVHRQHMRLAFNSTGDQLVVHDMGGRNGSYLNNQLIEKNGSALMQLGDKLRVGRVVMRLQPAPEVDGDGGS